jgi:hypothetical protein
MATAYCAVQAHPQQPQHIIVDSTVVYYWHCTVQVPGTSRSAPAVCCTGTV